MIKLVLILLAIGVCFVVFKSLSIGSNESISASDGGGELWVMIEIDDYFRSNSDLSIEEDVIALVEASGLGEVDGHSSGANQFDFNFYDVSDYEKAKTEISNFLNSKYPKMNYVISKEYKTTFDKVSS